MTHAWACDSRRRRNADALVTHRLRDRYAMESCPARPLVGRTDATRADSRARNRNQEREPDGRITIPAHRVAHRLFIAGHRMHHAGASWIHLRVVDHGRATGRPMVRPLDPVLRTLDRLQ